MCADIKNIYLGTPLGWYEYMRIPLKLFTEHVIKQYIYAKIIRMYGLPQAVAFSNKLLKERLYPHGYDEVPHTPGLWRKILRPISCILVVDYFGVKYVVKQHAEHLKNKYIIW